MKIRNIGLQATLSLIILAFILSGCATYKFQKSTSGSQGYLVSYDGKPIPEYTIGKEKSLPDLPLAKERFKRRRSTVEFYCKKMNQIESRLKEFLWEPPAMLFGFIGGIFRWPFTAVDDYKYNHNPQYKEKMDRLDEERDTLERARVNSLREKLNAYIKDDLIKEASKPSAPAAPQVKEALPAPAEKIVPAVTPEVKAVEPALSEKTLSVTAAQPLETKVNPEEAPQSVQSVPSTQSAPVLPEKQPAETKAIIQEKALAQAVVEPPVAIITAKPLKGYSPLLVKFSGQKSHTKAGRIVSYNWDFGDGDTSAKKNPENTYWSTTYGLPRNYTATLTVRDQAGNASSASVTIEVNTR